MYKKLVTIIIVKYGIYPLTRKGNTMYVHIRVHIPLPFTKKKPWLYSFEAGRAGNALTDYFYFSVFSMKSNSILLASDISCLQILSIWAVLVFPNLENSL